MDRQVKMAFGVNVSRRTSLIMHLTYAFYTNLEFSSPLEGLTISQENLSLL